MNYLSKIEKELKTFADNNIAKHSLRFFKTGIGEYGYGDIFLGIRVPTLRLLAKKYRDINLNELISLLKSKYHEKRLLALLILVIKYQKKESKEEIYNLYLEHKDFINNWDLIDTSCPHIMGDYLKNRDKKILYELAKSSNLWDRRKAIIATFEFIRNDNFNDTLNISEILLNDKEDLIHKAVGWMLREVGKRDLESLEEFLKTYYKNMPRVMLRYAIEKFEESVRKSYLKGKSYKKK